MRVVAKCGAYPLVMPSPPRRSLLPVSVVVALVLLSLVFRRVAYGFEAAMLELRYFWWLVLILGGAVWLLVMAGRMQVNVFAADGSNTPGTFGQRLVRAHANCVENVPLFAAVLLYAMVTGQSQVTDPLAPILLGARILQSVVHLISTSALAVWIRFAAFFVQLLILIWWLLRLSTLI